MSSVTRVANINLGRIVAGEFSFADETGNEQYRSLISLIDHPGYDSLTFENDIGLLQVLTAVAIDM